MLRRESKEDGVQIRFSSHWDLLGPFQLGTRGMSV